MAAHVSADNAKPRVSQYTEKKYSADIRGGGGRRVHAPSLNPPLS